MNCKIFVWGALALLSALPVAAQRIDLDAGWEFQRLEKGQKAVEIRNQGTDWSSQFNIQHVEAANRALAVPSDTLELEFGQLAAGEWERVDLPHTPFVEPLVVLHQWQGVCYYRRQLDIRPADEGKQLWLEFEGAMHLADLWVNGHHVAQHSGGYTPFVADVTGLLHAGRPNELLVRLDNRDNPLIPPGKPLGELDFCYYGGLYRDVRLIVKEPVHITHPILADEVAGGGIFVTYPAVSEEKALVEVRTHVANRTDAARQLTIRQTLYEWSKERGCGRKTASVGNPLAVAAGTAVHASQQLAVDRPRLWSPDSPSLYVLRTEVLDGKRVLDCEDTRIGIRRIEMSKEKGFVINGKPLRLEGTNRHQEYPYVGNAIPDQAQYRELESFSKFGGDMDPVTAMVIDKGRKNSRLLIQPQHAPMPVEEEIAVIYCGTKGLLKDVALPRVAEFEKFFLDVLRSHHREDVLEPLAKGLLDDKTAAVLEKVAEDAAQRFKE